MCDLISNLNTHADGHKELKGETYKNDVYNYLEFRITVQYWDG